MAGRNIYEARKVATLYGEYGWNDPDDPEQNASSLDSGYRAMNDEINALAEKVTIHAVSYTHVVLPEPGQFKTMKVYATIVYSGYINPASFGSDPHTGTPPYDENSTLFYVHL